MVKLARQLIERQEGKFEPADTEDRYEARLREVIDAKLKGEGIEPEAPAEPRGDNVIDLMAALKRSLGERRQRAGAQEADARACEEAEARRGAQARLASHSAPAVVACAARIRAGKSNVTQCHCEERKRRSNPHRSWGLLRRVAPRNDTVRLRPPRACAGPRAEHLQLDRLHRPRRAGALPEGDRHHRPLRRVRQPGDAGGEAAGRPLGLRRRGAIERADLLAPDQGRRTGTDRPRPCAQLEESRSRADARRSRAPIPATAMARSICGAPPASA